MIRILVNGSTGKMGQEVIKSISRSNEFYLFGGIDKFKKENANYKTYSSISELFNIADKPDSIIDFSVPEASLAVMDYAKEFHIPVVVATTGFSSNEQNKIKDISKFIPIFQSANMSFDINIMRNTVANLATLLTDDDIEIVETHHNSKLDSPSGTAMMLADSINRKSGNKYTYIFNRHDNRQKREKNEIGFSSIRGGNIVGEHSVLFFSDDESLEVKHIAYSRAVYAKGALKATKFIINKPAGYYTMNDLI
jgi:4-hydroxy-tetrahydrodipicolinate reductase